MLLTTREYSGFERIQSLRGYFFLFLDPALQFRVALADHARTLVILSDGDDGQRVALIALQPDECAGRFSQSLIRLRRARALGRCRLLGCRAAATQQEGGKRYRASGHGTR